MSTVLIIQGDSKFELIAQMIDCARGLSWKDRTPFKFCLRGNMGDFLDGISDSDNTPVTIQVEVLFTEFRSQGDYGNRWHLGGKISLKSLDPDDQNLLKRLERFSAEYSVLTRTGSIKPL